MYDPRVGRWFKTDVFESKRPDVTPYRGFLNNPIYYTDPDGNFEFPEHVAKQYPLVNHFLKSISDYYIASQMEGSLPEDFMNAFPATLQEAFKEFSGLNSEQIITQLTYVFASENIAYSSSNPQISVQNLDEVIDGEAAFRNGESHGGLIKLDDDLVSDMEIALRQMGYGRAEDGSYPGVEYLDDDNTALWSEEITQAPVMTKEQIDQAIKAFTATFFHENVHEGRIISNLPPALSRTYEVIETIRINSDFTVSPIRIPKQTNEPGQVFEQGTYGEHVGRLIPPGGEVQYEEVSE